MTATHKKPQIERELKFAGVDLDQLRSRLLELECEAFLSLCGEPLSQARIMFMLEKGKPLRN